MEIPRRLWWPDQARVVVGEVGKVFLEKLWQKQVLSTTKSSNYFEYTLFCRSVPKKAFPPLSSQSHDSKASLSQPEFIQSWPKEIPLPSLLILPFHE